MDPGFGNTSSVRANRGLLSGAFDYVVGAKAGQENEESG